MQKDCPNWLAGWLILILASMCTVAPLAFLDISEGQWIEGARGAMVVNENLKFAAFLFFGLFASWECLLGAFQWLDKLESSSRNPASSYFNFDRMYR